MNNETIQHLFFANHPDPMWIYDLESLRFLDVNDAAVARYGYSRDEFLAMTIADIRPEEDVPRLMENLRSSALRLEESGIWRHRLKSGAVIHVDIRSCDIPYEGRRARLVSARDVSRLVELDLEKEKLLAAEREARTLAEAANRKLKEQQANLRTAQRLLRLGLWSYDISTGRLTWSDEVYTIYGVDRRNFQPTFETYFALVHPDDRDDLLARYEAFLASSDRHFEFQHRVLRSDGGTVHVRGVGERLESPEGTAIQGVVQDVTQQMQAQERLAQADFLMRLAGRVARLGGWRVDLRPERITWTAETAAIHEEQPGISPTVQQAIDYYIPEHREQIAARFQACVEQGEPFDEVLQIETARGNRIWVRAIGEAERDADGTIVAVQGALQDVTEFVAARERMEGLSRRLRETLENISDAFLTLDTNWRVTFMNSQAEALLDRPAHALVGQNIWEAFPEAVGSTFQKQYERAVDRRKTVRFTEFYPPLDKWFEVNAYPTADGLAIYFRNVTRERERIAQLRLLEAAVARQNDILIITEAEPVDAPDGPKIVYVNDAFVRRTGYAREEVIGLTPRFLQGPKTQRSELERIRAALKSWRPVRAELINYTRSGEEFWLELDIVPIADEKGWYTHWVAVERDITERKEAEQALRVSEERFRLMARATNDVVWDWDMTSGKLWWSENMLTQFGHDPETLEPGLESWTNRVHPEDRARVLESIYAVIEGTGTKWTEEYRFVHADGRLRIVEDRGFVIRNEAGDAIRMIGSMSDITERRELDDRLRQSQKLEAVGQLTGGVAHDFNNLLTVILGNAELLSEKLTDQQQLRMLAEMTATAAERGAELTSRLLAFARRQALEPRLVDINRLIAGMDRLLRRTLTEDIDIEIVQAGGLWLAEVDPGQLEVALLNLAINARDAMPNGGRLTIETANAVLDDSYARTHQEVSAGQYVMVSVTDTGTGMSPDVAERAFEPFFTTKEVGRGSGLGLSMVYGFVKQSGGHAKIYSEPGEGTTVKLYFPRARASGPLPKEIVGPAVIGGNETILVVEDNHLVRGHLVNQLKGLGYRVIDAGNGPEALEILHQIAEIDLLLTDVVMPGGMSGRDLADAATALRPGLKVLFTSGYTDNAIVHQGRLDPGVHLLSKPYRRQELAEKVRRVLEDPPPRGRK